METHPVPGPARPPRIAYFPDTYHEVNGAARTGRQLTEYAARKNLPFLCVRPGQAVKQWRERSVEAVELRRGRLAFRIEKDLWQDPALLRYRGLVRKRFEAFRPDIVHVTSMGDFGILGWALACEFGLSMVVSWHTNVHEYAAWRFEKIAQCLPARPRGALAGGIERISLAASLWFYSKGAVALAPNRDLVEILRCGTGQPTFLMERGVDTVQFDPARRKRDRGDGTVVFGYVGRLSPEKNLRVLRRLEDSLRAAGLADYRIDIVGHGAESAWLEANLDKVRLRGVLLGDELADAYADMDVFLFPSRTDTYGNAVWEACACGVPAVVSDAGGPRHIVRDGETGLVSGSDEEFVKHAIALYRDRGHRDSMGRAGRAAALRQSWDAVFERLYAEAYPVALT